MGRFGYCVSSEGRRLKFVELRGRGLELETVLGCCSSCAGGRGGLYAKEVCLRGLLALDADHADHADTPWGDSGDMREAELSESDLLGRVAGLTGRLTGSSTGADVGLISAGSGMEAIEGPLPKPTACAPGTPFDARLPVEEGRRPPLRWFRLVAGGMPTAGSGGRAFRLRGSQRALKSLRMASRSLVWRFGSD